MRNKQRVENLLESLPYIQKFQGKTFVLKYGGSIMENEENKLAFIEDIVLLNHLGIKCIIIHGGGKEINARLEKLGIESEFKEGYRVTSKDAIDEVEMILTGRINKELTCLLNNAGAKAVGLNGKDGGLIRATKKYVTLNQRQHDIGQVGQIDVVNPEILELLLESGYVPVISPIGFDRSGMTFNINADDVAAEISAKLSAEKLIMITDVPGVLEDVKKPDSLMSKLTLDDIERLTGSDAVKGGMTPKLKCAQTAVCGGTNSVHILNGTIKHCVVLETFTEKGIGSMITYR
ncbi:acetylglutamate kinase [Fusibacter sp. JL216-2]|uniref:acetylglutamate kinase n=1 Tax=Fusibacter sp. JL216-2 TaxID=3071453 RepID=UPI003D34F9B3